jgi:hypothetical protein
MNLWPKKQHTLKAWSSISHASSSTNGGYEAERSAYEKKGVGIKRCLTA